MITKVKHLKNIGKFYDYSAKGDGLGWHKNTFVFAPNAYGKSTLVNVLRSLRDNDKKMILARKTIGAKTAPEAVIVIDGINYIFNGIRWEKSFPEIMIFDIPYINDNILTYEISHEHKKNIHKIIIGEKGRTLAEELAALKTNEKAKNQELNKLDEQFKKSAFTFSQDEFLAIPPTDEATISQRIQKLEKDIKSKETEGIVRGFNLPRTIDIRSIDLSKAKELAVNKLASFHEDTYMQISNHIERNFRDKTQSKEFIKKGLDQIKADCPLCGQNLGNAADLLRAYNEYFNQEYQTYQQQIDQELIRLGDWNVESELTMIVSSYNLNLAVLTKWEPYLGSFNFQYVVDEVEKCRIDLSYLKSKVINELEMKQKDPNVDADISSFNKITIIIDKLKKNIEAYNIGINEFIEKAKEYIDNIPKSDVLSIKAELEKQKEIKKRFSPEWIKWAEDYSKLKRDKNTILIQKNAKHNELEDYSKNIFETYQRKINELLDSMGADFAITGLTGKTDERAKESYSDFGFLILEQTVPLTNRQDDAPCFKNTLSEGDKSTLAFAFFIATLEKMPEIDRKIVVFDDPLSSLDETRREATTLLLLTLSTTVNQLNVFTHKKDFLYRLCDVVKSNKVLQIRSDKKNGSQLADLDVEEDRKSDHARLIENMKHYLIEDFGPTAETMQGNLRILFETVLKTKYYNVLVNDIKAKHGFATLLTRLFASGLLNESLKPKLFRLCSLADGPHHGEIVDGKTNKLSRDELIPLIREALDLVHKV